MTPEEFLDEFGTLAESAEGVPKLRELILELAVRGKLVEQEPEDDFDQDTTVSDFMTIQNGYAFKSTWFVKQGTRTQLLTAAIHSLLNGNAGRI